MRGGLFFSAEGRPLGGQLSNQRREFLREFPALGFRVIRSGLVTNNRRCSYVINGSELLLPESAHPGPWNIKVGHPITGGVEFQKENYLMVDLKTVTEVSSGIFVGSWSTHNWYHWTIDTLPSVFLANKLPKEFANYPLLLPHQALTKESWLEALRAVAGTREIVELPSAGYLEVENLLWIDSPSNPGPLPRKARLDWNFSLHQTAMREYRDFVLSMFAPESDGEPFRRIFLARKVGSLRPYNQRELIEVAAGFGFEAVYLEDMTFEESIRTMREAELVVGPHGAGWASALFCRPGIASLMWSHQGREWNWFTNVAEVAQFEMHHLVLPPSRDRFDLDPVVFRSKIQSLVRR